MGFLERLTRKAEPDGTSPSKAGTAPPAPVPPSPPGPPPSSAPVAATPPAQAPAAAPPPGLAAPAPVFKELLDKINGLTTSLQADRQEVKGFTDRIKSMEDRMKSLQGLSELVSMRYNPFLEDAEEEMFDGRAPKRDDGNGPAPPANDARAAPVDGRSVGGAPAAPPADTSGPLREVVRLQPGPSSGHAGLAPGPEAPAPPPSTNGATHAPASTFNPVVPAREPRIGPGWSVFAANPRTSYLALAWFDALVQSVGPRALHPLLDYYRDVGWLSPEVHSWLDRLASGVSPHEGPDTEGALPNDAHKLLRLHMSSLRFFDFLFRANFSDTETGQLEAAVKRLVHRR